jgi:hypothetical protein
MTWTTTNWRAAELCDPARPASARHCTASGADHGGRSWQNGDAAHFRELAPGELDVASFTVTNSGSTALTGLRWTLERAQAGSFALTSPVQELAAGASATFQVAFLPVLEGPHLASLRIDQGAANTTQFVMELSGSCADRPVNLWLEEVGAGPAAQVIDFGSPAIGTTVKKTFRLVNAGNRTFTGRVNLYNPEFGKARVPFSWHKPLSGFLSACAGLFGHQPLPFHFATRREHQL